MFEFRLPDLGEGIHEGEILKWHVAQGDTIAEDAPLVEVETDKAAVTIPSPRAGRIMSLGGQVGEIVKTGAVLVVIDDGSGPAAVAPPQTPKARAPEPAPQSAAVSASVPSGPSPKPVATSVVPAPAVSVGLPVPAAPATRRLARELGVDLASVTPTGSAGRVTNEDVRRTAEKIDEAAGAPARPADQAASRDIPEPDSSGAFEPRLGSAAIPLLDLDPLPDFSVFGPVRREPLRSIRRKTARHMVTASVLVPHVAHMDEADVTDLEALRHQEQAARPNGPRLSLLPFVMKAVVAGLKAYPAFNASVDPFREEIWFKDYYSVGFAADTPRGLIVPVIRDAASRSIMELATAVEALAIRARDGTMSVDDMQGGTFTITNIGALGGTGLMPLINYPETAILGMGRASPKPVVRNGEIVVRTMLPLTLAFDHRVADGAEAARFVNELVRRLERPMALLLEA